MRRAMKLLDRACELDPTISEFWLLLGHGRYRTGDSAGALAAFGRSGVDKPHPTTLAVVAMAQHRAGQTEHAKATLARVREAAKVPPVSTDAQAQRFLKEAESLLEGKKP